MSFHVSQLSRHVVLFFLLTITTSASANLIITGVIDGPLSGGTPKAVEFYATTDIADLSAYGFGSANNGGGTNGEEYTFPSVAVTAGDFIYVASEATQFNNFFGFMPDYTDSAASINGDDAIELFQNGSVIDVFGEIDQDGTGRVWDHLDGWAYREDGTTANGGNFNGNNWSYSGTNALDGESTNAGAANPFPSRSYSSMVSTEPVANAGADQTVLTNAMVTLDGSGSTDDVAVTSYTWTQTSGTAVGALASVAQPTFQAPATAGVLEFSLVVGDGNTTSPPDTVTITVNAPGACTPATRLISAIQGSGTASPFDGQIETIQGIVTQLGRDGRGYWVQEENNQQDADTDTSEGIYVFDSSNTPTVGHTVSVTGTVDEFFGLTEITNVTAFEVCDTNITAITPVDLSLPFATIPDSDNDGSLLDEANHDLEKYEGMLVRFPQTLTVTETFWLARMGQLTLSSSGKQDNPTQVALPGAAANAIATTNLRDRIVLDDGIDDSSFGRQNPDPMQYPGFGDLTYNNEIRSGYTLSNLTGIVHFAGNRLTGSFVDNFFRIVPTENISFNEANPRSNHTTVPSVGGELTVASFNVLNYFSTIDDGSDNCGPSSNLECRGADDEGVDASNRSEFDRQKTKIINALQAIDADVVGLVEIENNNTDAALIDLVDSLNAVVGAGTYDYVRSGVLGSDAIKVAFIFKDSTIDLVGSHAMLDYGDQKNRTTLIQTFKPKGFNGDTKNFTVAVNHFKSKGSDCDDLSYEGVADVDQGDGQGNCNLTRLSAANRLIDYLNDTNFPNTQGFMVIGDLNAYGMEDPIRAFLDAGYVDLAADRIPDSYSYVFDGEWGTLDYILASPSLNGRVSGIGKWNINSDEPAGFDYDMTFKADAQDNSYYDTSFFRSSDHDPVIAGLNGCSISTAMETSSTLTIPSNQWIMFGLPLQPSSGSDTVAAVFDELTTGEYGSTWFVYEIDNATSQYLPLSTSSSLSVGKAYWIITLGSAVDVTLTGSPASLNNECYTEIPLYATGYDLYGQTYSGENAIGNPHNFTADWAKARVLSGSTYRTPADADTAGIMEASIIKGPSGSGSDYESDGGYTYSGPVQDPIFSWEAFWVSVESSMPSGSKLAMPR